MTDSDVLMACLIGTYIAGTVLLAGAILALVFL